MTGALGVSEIVLNPSVNPLALRGNISKDGDLHYVEAGDVHAGACTIKSAEDKKVLHDTAKEIVSTASSEETSTLLCVHEV